MGEMKVPASALYGASTQRAVENFPVSGLRFGRDFLRVLGLLKAACAEVNRELGRLDGKLAAAIARAAEAVAEGRHDDQFPLDVFQTGSGTSTNMNFNEVAANLANLALGGKVGARQPVHPNDHVNLGQSSNDVIPTMIHLAAAVAVHEKLLPALKGLGASLDAKAKAFAGLLKIGRTHLQDATPLTLGQELSGYAAQVKQAVERIERSAVPLQQLALGGTAVGTGINTHPEFGARVAKRLSARLKLPFREAENHFAAQGSMDSCVELSGALKATAVALFKIANDVRWLGSGPRCGLGEIRLPETQPGSSIMPGKVNPVIAESLLQVCAQVVGNDAAVTWGGANGNFELNTMLPLIARNLLESLNILAGAVRIFDEKCVRGIEADEARLRENGERSLMLATALVPVVGYDKAAEVAKEAYRSRRTVREVAASVTGLPADRLAEILDPSRMTGEG